MFKATSKNNVITENTTILADGFGSITIKNKGTDTALINDNIELEAGETFGWDNHPNVTIAENISVRFAGVDVTRKLLVFKTYFKDETTIYAKNPIVEQTWKPNKR